LNESILRDAVGSSDSFADNINYVRADRLSRLTRSGEYHQHVSKRDHRDQYVRDREERNESLRRPAVPVVQDRSTHEPGQWPAERSRQEEETDGRNRFRSAQSGWAERSSHRIVHLDSSGEHQDRVGECADDCERDPCGDRASESAIGDPSNSLHLSILFRALLQGVVRTVQNSVQADDITFNE